MSLVEITNAEGSMTELGQLAEQLRAFSAARDWDRYHTPKNLIMALVGEIGELAAEFQWLTAEQSQAVMADEGRAGRVRAEMADVTIYLVRLADVLGVDLVDVARDKIEQNERRYPAESFRGSAAKAPPLPE